MKRNLQNLKRSLGVVAAAGVLSIQQAIAAMAFKYMRRAL
jgi:hypothetical protein